MINSRLLNYYALLLLFACSIYSLEEPINEKSCLECAKNCSRIHNEQDPLLMLCVEYCIRIYADDCLSILENIRNLTAREIFPDVVMKISHWTVRRNSFLQDALYKAEEPKERVEPEWINAMTPNMMTMPYFQNRPFIYPGIPMPNMNIGPIDNTGYNNGMRPFYGQFPYPVYYPQLYPTDTIYKIGPPGANGNPYPVPTSAPYKRPTWLANNPLIEKPKPNSFKPMYLENQRKLPVTEVLNSSTTTESALETENKSNITMKTASNSSVINANKSDEYTEEKNETTESAVETDNKSNITMKTASNSSVINANKSDEYTEEKTETTVNTENEEDDVEPTLAKESRRIRNFPQDDIDYYDRAISTKQDTNPSQRWYQTPENWRESYMASWMEPYRMPSKNPYDNPYGNPYERYDRNYQGNF